MRGSTRPPLLYLLDLVGPQFSLQTAPAAAFGFSRLLNTAASHPELVTIRTFTHHDVATFTALTGDANALHTAHAAAKAAGFPSPIVPGLLIASLFPAIIGTNFPGSVYLTQTLKFRKFAEVGATVRASVRLERLRGSRATFFTECRLVNASVDEQVDEAAGPLLVEGTALALLRGSSAATPS